MAIKTLVLTGIVWAGVSLAAAANGDTDAKREQLRLEAQGTYGSVERALKTTLEKINLNQRLTDEQLKKAGQMLETNRRHFTLYEAPQKAGFMLFQAWVCYFQNDPVGAINWASRACKEDPTSGDAWASQTAIALALGRRPLEPQAARPRPQGRRPRSEEDMAAMGDMSAPVGYGTQGVLTFDLNALRREVMRERLTLQEFKSPDGQTVLFRPNENMLCLLLWKAQTAAETDDPFADKPAETAAPASPDAMGMPGMPGMTPADQGSAEVSPLAEQQAYFEAMSDALAEQKEMRFVEISLNAAADAEKVSAERLSAVPLVFAAAAGSGATAFGRIDANTPVMLIIDKDGQIKYAGPASGFMPAFILSHLTGKPIDLGVLQVQPGEIPVMDPSAASPETAGGAPMMPPPGMPGMPMPEMENTAPEQAAPAEKKYKELPVEQQVEAEKKIAFIRDLYIRGSKMRVQSYKRGVDMCREIMRDYPGTIYAEEARMLLRQVPENRRSTYNITNEELGL